jgi:hypothetical protein
MKTGIFDGTDQRESGELTPGSIRFDSPAQTITQDIVRSFSGYAPDSQRQLTIAGGRSEYATREASCCGLRRLVCLRAFPHRWIQLQQNLFFFFH